MTGDYAMRFCMKIFGDPLCPHIVKPKPSGSSPLCNGGILHKAGFLSLNGFAALGLMRMLKVGPIFMRYWPVQRSDRICKPFHLQPARMTAGFFTSGDYGGILRRDCGAWREMVGLWISNLCAECPPRGHNQRIRRANHPGIVA